MHLEAVARTNFIKPEEAGRDEWAVFFERKEIMKSSVVFSVVVVLTSLVVLNNRIVLGEPVTVMIWGTVNSVETQGGFTFDGLGDVMTGYCTYDTDAPDLDSSSHHGAYPLTSLSMTIGDYTFFHNLSSPDAALFEVWKTDITYWAGSEHGVLSINGVPQPYNDIAIELIYLCNASSNGPDDALPVSFPDISFFTWRNDFHVAYSDSQVDFEIRGVLDSITAIPEPATLVLLCFGGAVLLGRRG